MSQFWKTDFKLNLMGLLVGGVASGVFLTANSLPTLAQVPDVTAAEDEPGELSDSNGAQERSTAPLRYQLPQDYSLGDFSKTGAPQRRGSAGSRGDCPALALGQPPAQAILPLVPGTLESKAINVALGHTTSSHPTFWFNIPYSSAQVNSLELTIVEADSQELLGEVSLAKVLHPKQPGVWGFQWPQSSPELAVGQRYQWFLVIECATDYGSGLLMTGLVERQELSQDLAAAIAQAAPRERVSLYARNGIWHEAITELNQLREIEPENSLLQQDWISLLDSIGIGEEL